MRFGAEESAGERRADRRPAAGSLHQPGAVEADAKAGNPKHDAKSIDIVRLSPPLLSNYAFYAQENSLDEMGHILTQRLYTLEALKDGTVMQRIFTFSAAGAMA